MTQTARTLARETWVLFREGAGIQQLSGTLKSTQTSVSITYVGAATHLEQCTAFLDGPVAHHLEEVLDPDVLAVTEPLHLPLPHVLRYSPFLDAVLDVQPSVEAQIRAVRSKAHRRRLRKAFKSPDWAWSESSTPQAMATFYETLHRPHVVARFGDKQIHEPLEHLQARLAKGGRVLTVTHRGEPVCGAALFDTPDGLDYDRNGFRPDSLKSPVVLSERTAALELAIFQLAQELGTKSIFLGFCRALADDGLFTHKRRLGCRFQPARASARSQLWVRPELRPRFFASLPLMMGPVGEFEVHVGLSKDTPVLSRHQWRARLKNFAIPAVKRAVAWTDLPAADPHRQQFEESLRTALGKREVEVHGP